jgi:hypothetical protein
MSPSPYPPPRHTRTSRSYELRSGPPRHWRTPASPFSLARHRLRAADNGFFKGFVERVGGELEIVKVRLARGPHATVYGAEDGNAEGGELETHGVGYELNGALGCCVGACAS